MKKERKQFFLLLSIFLCVCVVIYFFIKMFITDYQKKLAFQFFRKGKAEYQAFHFNKAIQEFRKAGKIEPQSLRIKINIDLALAEKDKFIGHHTLKNACHIFDVFKNMPNIPEKYKGKADLYLGELYFMRGAHRFTPNRSAYLQTSLSFLNQAIHHSGGDPVVLGCAESWKAKSLFLERKDYLEVLSDARKAGKTFPYIFGPCQHLIGVVHIIKGKPEKALKNFENVLIWLKTVWLPSMRINQSSFPQVFYGRFALVDWITYDILWRSRHPDSPEQRFPQEFVPGSISVLRKRWKEDPNQVIMTFNLYRVVLKAVQLREENKTKSAVSLLIKTEKQIRSLPLNPVPHNWYTEEHRRAEELKALLFAWMAEMEKGLGRKKRARQFLREAQKASGKGFGEVKKLLSEVS
ncbi:MAG: hypothetical protein M1169_06090 [Firmicutes bacterium]|nr:hypothetical protein [Bacillota bacterium]